MFPRSLFNHRGAHFAFLDHIHASTSNTGNDCGGICQAAWITFKDTKDEKVLEELTSFDPAAEEVKVESAIADMDALGLEVRKSLTYIAHVHSILSVLGICVFIHKNMVCILFCGSSVTNGYCRRNILVCGKYEYDLSINQTKWIVYDMHRFKISIFVVCYYKESSYVRGCNPAFVFEFSLTC